MKTVIGITAIPFFLSSAKKRKHRQGGSVSKIPVAEIIEAAKKALYTGHIGDGKIFVYNVGRVIKIRTGEEDFAALQDVE